MVAVIPQAEYTQLNEKHWLIAPFLWLLLAVPATLGMYGGFFAGRWGGAEDAENSDRDPLRESHGDSYLRGVTSVWMVLAFGVVLSLAACLLAGSATPAIWPGALMMMLLILARPTAPANSA